MIQQNGLNFFYRSDGTLDSINDASTGRTIAVINTDGSLNAKYNTTEAQQIKAQYQPTMWARADQATATAQQPDYLSFRIGMLSDTGYNRISAVACSSASGQLASQRIEIEFRAADVYLAILPQLWKTLIDILPIVSKPTSAEIQQWNTLASSTHMAFTFDASGYLKLT